MPINFDKQNDRVTDWARRNVSSLKGRSSAMGITHRADSPSPGSSVDKIKFTTRKRGEIVEIISFKFPRTLIWPHKGAGKGRAGDKGSVWYDAKGIRRTTDPKSFGKMGTNGRRAKPWFNTQMDSNDGVEELATIVAEESGDAIINNLLIK